LYSRKEKEKPKPNTWKNLKPKEREIYDYIFNKFYEEQLESAPSPEAAMSSTWVYTSPYYYYEYQCLANDNCPAAGPGALGYMRPEGWTLEMCTIPSYCVFNDYDDWVEEYESGVDLDIKP